MSIFNKGLDVVVLEKFQEIQNFIKSSVGKLEEIIAEQNIDKTKMIVNPDLKPLTMNVQKALEMISNFKLEPYRDRIPNPNQMHSQSRSSHYDNMEREQLRQTLPPIEPSRHKRSLAGDYMSPMRNSVGLMQKPSEYKPSDESQNNLNQLDTGKRLTDTPVFEK